MFVFGILLTIVSGIVTAVIVSGITAKAIQRERQAWFDTACTVFDRRIEECIQTVEGNV